MKVALLSILSIFSLLSLAQAADKESGGEQAVAALEQKWVDASKASDPDMLAPLLAFNYIKTGSDGKVIGKQETLARTKAAKWQSSQISDVKVTLYGKTAIATGLWEGKGTDDNGNTAETHERWTDTWVKMFDGKWQCVASHSSAVKM